MGLSLQVLCQFSTCPVVPYKVWILCVAVEDLEKLKKDNAMCMVGGKVEDTTSLAVTLDNSLVIYGVSNAASMF